MGLANKVNRSNSTVAEGINTKDLEYLKASDILFEGGDPIVLKGFFIQTGKYGESITVVTDRRGINLPKRYVEMFKSFTPEEIEEIKAGKLGIAAIKDAETDNGKTVFIDFVDL